MSSEATTTSTITPIHAKTLNSRSNGRPPKTSLPPTSKSLIEQLEAGHSDALTAYLDAMSRFHNVFSFGNILEIARDSDQPQPALQAFTRGTSLAASVMKGREGYPHFGSRSSVSSARSDEEAEKDTYEAEHPRAWLGFVMLMSSMWIAD